VAPKAQLAAPQVLEALLQQFYAGQIPSEPPFQQEMAAKPRLAAPQVPAAQPTR
jgi:hypothetical protein